MQLIVGDKRVNVTVRAKGAMTVIIALKGEELHKAGLPSRYIDYGTNPLTVLARVSMVSRCSTCSLERAW